MTLTSNVSLRIPWELRPDITGPFPLDLLRQEAQGLAAIHAANLGHTEAIAWLPRADRSYVTTYIQQRFWRPAWEQVVHDPTFVALFGAVMRRRCQRNTLGV